MGGSRGKNKEYNAWATQKPAESTNFRLWRDGRAWFNAPVLKSGGGAEPSLGSNPNPVAMKPVGFGGFLEGFSNNKKDAVICCDNANAVGARMVEETL